MNHPTPSQASALWEAIESTEGGTTRSQYDAVSDVVQQSLAARAERAEQQLDAVRALHTSSQETRGVGRGSPWRPYCDHCHQDWPCATIRALDGTQQAAPEPAHENSHTAACGDGRGAAGESRPEALTSRQAPAQRRESRT